MKLKKHLPLFIFAILTLALFYKFFLLQKYPIPADILLGHYHPWKDLNWGGIQTTYPIKNWSIFDAIRQTLPWRILAIDQIKNGQLPFWNPYQFSGTPLLATHYPAFFYPLNFLFIIFSPYLAWSLYICLQTFLAALFMYYFAKNLFKNKFIGLFAGLFWGFSLTMLNRLELGVSGHAALWLPLSLLSIDRLTKKPNFLWGFILSLSLLFSLLAGYPPLAIYAPSLLLLYLFYRSHFKLSSHFFYPLLFIVLGIGLSAPQMLPAYHLGQKVIRSESLFGQTSSETFFLPLKNLFLLFAPDLFGHPATWNYSSVVNYPEAPALGSTALFLFLTALFLIFKKKQPFPKKLQNDFYFWFFVSISSLLLIFDNPLAHLIRKVPFSFISDVTPIKLLWISSLSLTLLASFGLHYLKNKKDQNISFFKPVFIVFIPTLSFVLFFVSDPASKLTAQRNLLIPSLVLFSSALFLYFSLRYSKLRLVFLFLTFFVASFELIRQGWKYTSFISPDLIFPQTEIISYLEQNTYPHRFTIANAELLPTNSNLPYRAPVLGGYSSLRDSRYDYLIRLLDQPRDTSNLETYPRVIYQAGWQSPLSDLLGLKYLLTLDYIDHPKMHLLLEEGQTKLYENKEVYPKAFFVKKYFVEKELSSIAKKMQEIDPGNELVLEEEIFQNNLGQGQVELLDYQDNRIVLRTQNDRPGLLLLADAYDPGWKANLANGQKLRIFRADLNLRAVLIPPGNQEIKFTYTPPGFILGLVISFFSFLFLFFLSWPQNFLSKKLLN
jgi:hypothetical protein